MAITTTTLEEQSSARQKHAADRPNKQQQLLQSQQTQSSPQSAHHHHHQFVHRASCCAEIVTSNCSNSRNSEQHSRERQRRESQLLISKWAPIWTKRQSPEWKPRRASVASCQRLQLQHYQHQHQQTTTTLYSNNNSNSRSNSCNKQLQLTRKDSRRPEVFRCGNSAELKTSTEDNDEEDDVDEDDVDHAGGVADESDDEVHALADKTTTASDGSSVVDSSSSSSGKSSRSGSNSSEGSQCPGAHQEYRQRCCSSLCCCCFSAGQLASSVSALQPAHSRLSGGGTVHFAPVTSKKQSEAEVEQQEEADEVNRSSWSLCRCRGGEFVAGGVTANGSDRRAALTGAAAVADSATTSNSVASSSAGSSYEGCCCSLNSALVLAAAKESASASAQPTTTSNNRINCSSNSSAKNKPICGNTIEPAAAVSASAEAPVTLSAYSKRAPQSGPAIASPLTLTSRRLTTRISETESLQLQAQQRKQLIRSMMRRMVSEDCLRMRSQRQQQQQQQQQEAGSGLLLLQQNNQQQTTETINSNNSMKTSNNISMNNNNNNNTNNNNTQCSLKRRETTTGCLISGRQQISERLVISGSHEGAKQQANSKNTATITTRQRRRGETDLKHLVNGISTPTLHRSTLGGASPASSASSSSSSLSSSTGDLQTQEADGEAMTDPVELRESSEERLEAAIVESWLDDHPRFVRDYFVRKANHQLINDWLITNAKLNNLTAAHTTNGFSGSGSPTVEQIAFAATSARRLARTAMTSADVEIDETRPSKEALGNTNQPSIEEEKFKLAFKLESSASFNDRHAAARTQQTVELEACLRSNRSSSQSGLSHLSSPISMPVRKISATDFETRTGSGYLRPMVSRTPDGRPTFLSCCQLDVRSSSQGKDDDLFDKEKYMSETIARRERKSRQEVEERQSTCSGVGGSSSSSSSGSSSIEHDEIELVFELVKNICNDLDIQTLLHKILKNIAVLINADKSSLFLVRGDEASGKKHLVSQLFNVDQESDGSDMEQLNNKGPTITIPWGTGLVGYVAASGESINIANCYGDPRFTDTIDQQTGYVTRNMLCAPILDKRNEIVGVAQVINKRDGNQFSKSDELKFNRYLQFCGIGLRNAQSYENCQLENKRNQVILDLARIIFEEQSTIEQVVHKIILHTQSLLECERCQVLLIDDGSEDLEQLLQVPAAVVGSPNCISSSAAAELHDELEASSSSAAPAKPKWRPHFQRGSDSGAGSHGSSPCGSTNGDCSSNYSDLQQPMMTSRTATGEPAINQDSSKLFSLVFDLECGGSGSSDLVMHNNNNTTTTSNNREGGSHQRQQQQQQTSGDERRKFPVNIGITGYVAMTGKTLNIEDVHKCELFDSSVDENSNFKHKSILCMPIRNGKRQIIGVSQLINKKNGRPFKKNDEDLFEAFSIFCGLGIHNTLMYEKVLKIMAKQRVTFEVLSYHATAPLEEAKKLHAEQIPSSYTLNLTSLEFNDFSLDEQFMLKSCLRFFLDLDLMRRFQIDQLVFCNWILSVQKNYRTVTYHPIVGGNGLKASPVRYHNWRHAFNVSQMMFAILINTQICRALGELETLALLIACLCHDLDHRGTNNSFQIKTASPLAELYSTSTMEHHHFDQCVMILNSQGNQILANLSPEEYSRVISLLEEAILATDLANYFQKRELFFQLVNTKQFDWKSNEKHRSLLRCMLMTACDVAAITKPWSIQKIVADLVMSEFYQQGDIEKQELHIEPIDLMNREKMSKLPEMQIGFIDTICAPIYTAFAKLFPLELKPLLDGCLSNKDLWQELSQANKYKSDTQHSSGE